MRPLRFCYITTFYPPYSFGGDAVYTSRLANALAVRGHQVDVIHCVDSYNLLSDCKNGDTLPPHPNVTVYSLHSHLGWLSPVLAQQTGHTWPKTNRIREVLYSKTFDVIHYHNISLLGPQILELRPDYSNFLKLYTMHEHWLVCPMHVLWQDDQRLCQEPSCARCSLHFHRPPQWWRYTSLLARCAAHVDAFISPSLFTKRIHHDRGFHYPMTVLPNFVPTSAPVSPASDGPAWPRPYFLFVGRLEKIKGLHTLLPIFRNYEHADLLVAGDGTYESSLREAAAGIPAVHFLGKVERPRLQKLCQGAIALIVPSVCYESFGLVVTEAYEQGTPAIARDLGSLSELIENSGAGFLYQNDQQLLAAMERLRTDGALRRTMAAKARLLYRKTYTEEIHLNAYFQLLDELALGKWQAVPWR